jgi:hypothetical protein
MYKGTSRLTMPDHYQTILSVVAGTTVHRRRL